MVLLVWFGRRKKGVEGNNERVLIALLYFCFHFHKLQLQLRGLI
jgi:hypothetical protein